MVAASVHYWRDKESVKRFERSNGLDTALYKTIPLPFFLHSVNIIAGASMINSPLIIVAYIHLSFVVFIIAQTNYGRRFRD